MSKLFNWFAGIYQSFQLWTEARDKKAIADIMEAQKRIATLERDIYFIKRTGKNFAQQNLCSRCASAVKSSEKEVDNG
jgi:hypothetical protein